MTKQDFNFKLHRGKSLKFDIYRSCDCSYTLSCISPAHMIHQNNLFWITNIFYSVYLTSKKILTSTLPASEIVFYLNTPLLSLFSLSLLQLPLIPKIKYLKTLGLDFLAGGGPDWLPLATGGTPSPVSLLSAFTASSKFPGVRPSISSSSSCSAGLKRFLVAFGIFNSESKIFINTKADSLISKQIYQILISSQSSRTIATCHCHPMNCNFATHYNLFLGIRLAPVANLKNISFSNKSKHFVAPEFTLTKQNYQILDPFHFLLFTRTLIIKFSINIQILIRRRPQYHLDLSRTVDRTPPSLLV